jgi:hypothetical protein
VETKLDALLTAALNAYGGHAMAQLVDALCCKPDVAGFILDGVTGNFSWT